MSKETREGRLSRRAFLGGAAMSAGAAGVTATAVATGAPAESKAESTSERTEAGYRETEHVRRVYELSRF